MTGILTFTEDEMNNIFMANLQQWDELTLKNLRLTEKGCHRMLCDKDCPIVESGTRNWSWFLFQQAAFVLLPDICQPNGAPGQAVPIPTHPGAAPANYNAGIVADYNRRMDLYREFEAMKTLFSNKYENS